MVLRASSMRLKKTLVPNNRFHPVFQMVFKLFNAADLISFWKQINSAGFHLKESFIAGLQKVNDFTNILINGHGEACRSS